MELRRGMRRSSAIHETFREETMSRNIPFFEMFAELAEAEQDIGFLIL